MDAKPPLPPYTLESAAQKVRLAEDAWNSRDPDRVALVYTEDRPWRNRAEFPVGREQVRQFLQRKWARELDYRPVKASINDLPIQAGERKFHRPLGRRPDDHPGLSDLGL